MRFIFLFGGSIGFFLAFAAGITAGRAFDLVLRDSAISCLAGAFLFRWFWSVFVKALSVAVRAKRAARAAAEEAEAAAKATPIKLK